MIFECGAIILLILGMALLMFRSGRRSYGIGILPLVVVPAVHIMGGRIALRVVRHTQWNPGFVWTGIDLAGLVICCLLLGFISAQMKRRRVRFAYLGLCGGFSVILSLVLVYDIMI